ncbi:MAG TPA: HEAT repeat domain-containing protein [Vicinamibacterales bacterium]|nr:HEAT repeat domain-containing protein [Vicinamibacterales bacterium]
MSARHLAAVLIVVIAGVSSLSSQTPARRPLSKTDVDAITTLLRLEDTRTLDEAALARLLKTAHPEVRRRAAMAVGRINKPEGRALLVAARGDADAEVAGAVVFATGQLKDADAVSWLAGVLSSPKAPAPVRREAARSLGKIRTPAARTALETYLASAEMGPASALITGEALLSAGRFTGPGDLKAVIRWAASTDPEVRWRAAWALVRVRDPGAVPALMKLSADPSAEVRAWAVRGLAIPAPTAASRAGGAPPPPPFDWSAIDRAPLAARLRAALGDSDRRVRTEALRALTSHDDDASVAAILTEIDSTDTWISVSAVEGLARYESRAAQIVPRLLTATTPARPDALRQAALAPLAALAPDKPGGAIDLAAALTKSGSVAIRASAVQTLARLGEPARAKLGELVAADPALKALVPPPPGAPRAPRPPPPVRPESEYRRIVERWIVPDYNGAAKPHAVLDTPRGPIEVELYPGDAPLGLEYFLRAVESGAIVGTEFGRLVPDFVAQQRAIRDDVTLRDEVTRRGLTRGNLSWANGGLDTGRPGYTLGFTPQPHNEGDFTTLGHVVHGLDAMDHLEFGDRITGARIGLPQ